MFKINGVDEAALYKAVRKHYDGSIVKSWEITNDSPIMRVLSKKIFWVSSPRLEDIIDAATNLISRSANITTPSQPVYERVNDLNSFEFLYTTF